MCRGGGRQLATFGGLSGSPKVTTVLQRRALAMNPRYIFVVSYQMSSNMVASATSPLIWRVCSCFLVFGFCFLVTPRLLLSLFVFCSRRGPPLLLFVVSPPQAPPPPKHI